MASNNNLLKAILQGGACNTDNQSFSQSSNPVKNLLQEVFLGKARTTNKIGNYYPDEPIMQGNLPLQQQIIKEKNLMKEFPPVAQNNIPSYRTMEENWRKEQSHNRNQEKIERQKKEKGWKGAQKEAQKSNKQEIKEGKKLVNKAKGEEDMMYHPHHYVEPWMPNMANPFMFENNFGGFPQARQQSVPQQVNAKKEGQSNKVNDQIIDKTINLMENDSDTRFQNSKYLEFLKSSKNRDQVKEKIKQQSAFLNHEATPIEISMNKPKEEEQGKEEEMMEAVWDEEEEKVLAEEMMEAAWNEEEKILAEEEEVETKEKEKIVLETCKIGTMKHSKKKQASRLSTLEATIKEAKRYLDHIDELDTLNFEENKELDKEASKEAEDEESNEDEFDLGLESAYKFSENNPYLQVENCLDKALNALNTGDTTKAILYLESILQRRPNDENCWLLLGKIHQDNDQEEHARDCLLKALEINSTNLGTLLSLGISLTNISDNLRAMKCFSRWISKHPSFRQATKKNHTIKDICSRKDYKITLMHLKSLNQDLIEVFEKVSKTNSKDPELHCAQAVLYFVAKDYNASLYHFNEALKYDPANYSLWNKLGSTLASLSKATEAIEAYYRALEYKPNFVRVWVNLAAAQAFKGEYEEAARLYLTALSINSKALHVWENLKITLIALGKHELAELTKERNLNLFKEYFDVITLEDLPPPEIEYQELHKNYLYKDYSEKWVQEFA